MTQVKLKHLKIQKYRNVKPGTELRFDDGINLVLGQNASGKTTLLALISAVCRADFRELEDDDFEIEADIHFDTRLVSMSISHERSAPPVARTKGWRCRFSAGVDEPEEIDDVPEGWESLDLSYSALSAAPFGTIGQAFRFDESLDAFLAATGRSAAVKGVATPPPSLIETERREAGSYLLLRRDYSPWGRHPIRPLSLIDEPLCREIAIGLDVRKVVGHPEIREHGTRNGHEYYRIEGYSFEVTRHDETWVHHDRLSYGQKRLLAFHYYLACNPSVVIADELVNGLHHRWIDACMKALGDRQAFLTSQNPLLFDYVEFDSVEQVQSRFITCRLEQVDGREQMVWENMHRDDAERFFTAYEAEIEHVGEILITRGLW